MRARWASANSMCHSIRASTAPTGVPAASARSAPDAQQLLADGDQHLREHGVLGREVLVERRPRDAAGRPEIGDRDAVEAALGEQVRGDVEDLLAPRGHRPRLAPANRGPGCRPRCSCARARVGTGRGPFPAQVRSLPGGSGVASLRTCATKGVRATRQACATARAPRGRATHSGAPAQTPGDSALQIVAHAGRDPWTSRHGRFDPGRRPGMDQQNLSYHVEVYDAAERIVLRSGCGAATVCGPSRPRRPECQHGPSPLPRPHPVPPAGLRVRRASTTTSPVRSDVHPFAPGRPGRDDRGLVEEAWTTRRPPADRGPGLTSCACSTPTKAWARHDWDMAVTVGASTTDDCSTCASGCCLGMGLPSAQARGRHPCCERSLTGLAEEIVTHRRRARRRANSASACPTG